MLVGRVNARVFRANGKNAEKSRTSVPFYMENTNAYPFCAKNILHNEMEKKEMTKTKKLLICLLAIISLAVVFVSCNTTPSDEVWKNATYTKNKEFGSGAKTVTVEVIVGDNSVEFTVKTDKENLADALLEHGLVSGDDSAYGLYIKYVNGMRADYDVDLAYWGLTKNGETLLDGASFVTELDGAHYEFTYTK